VGLTPSSSTVKTSAATPSSATVKTVAATSPVAVTSPSGTASSQALTPQSVMAFTGANIETNVIVALITLALGIALVVASRRTRRSVVS
jgi:hypothetical protein